MSDRVEEEHQAKIQAAWHWTNNIGIIAGAYIWNRYLWDATGNGLGAPCVARVKVLQWELCDARYK